MPSNDQSTGPTESAGTGSGHDTWRRHLRGSATAPAASVSASDVCLSQPIVLTGAQGVRILDVVQKCAIDYGPPHRMALYRVRLFIHCSKQAAEPTFSRSRSGCMIPTNGHARNASPIHTLYPQQHLSFRDCPTRQLTLMIISSRAWNPA